MKVDMSPKAVKERLNLAGELWLLSMKLMNSKKIDKPLSNECPLINYKTGELAYYLYHYCPHLLSEVEKTAYMNTMVAKKIEKAESPVMKDKLQHEFFASDEEVLELLRAGEEVFFNKLEQRVLHDNPAQDFLNLCPKCGYLTKTPQAKQCRQCYHSWHEEIEK